jgi:S1-C subfamily serine protease
MTGEEAITAFDKEIFAVSQVRFAKDGCTKENDSASGFFFTKDGQLYFITNRHVVIDENDWFYPDELRLKLHTDAKNLTKHETFPIPLYEDNKPKWLEHPEMGKKIDVVALSVNVPAPYHVIPFSKEDLLPEMRYLPLGEDLLVIGYPLGIFDSKHNTPIVRSASIASLYSLPYEEKPYFLIDSRLHAGTSGSPVLVKPSIIQPAFRSKPMSIQ